VIKEVPKIITEQKVVVKEVIKEVVKVVAPTAVPFRVADSRTPAHLVGYIMHSRDPNPKYGGVVRTAGPSEMQHFDLHQGAPAYTGITNVYNKLLYRNVGYGLEGIVPDLASGWEVSEQGLVYVFPLRQGVKWHDGTEFTSADVVATFNRILNPPAGVDTKVTGDRYEFVDKVEALDKNLVKFTLKRPTPWFLSTMAAAPHFGYAVIYPKAFLEAHDQDVRKNIPPGTGAFKYVRRLPGEFIEMEANPDYFIRGLPYVDGAKALHIPNWRDRGSAVLGGISDFGFNTHYTIQDEAKKSPGKFKQSNPVCGYVGGVRINTLRPPWDDVRVRRAVWLAYDRQFIRDVGTEGHPWASPPTRWQINSSPYALSHTEINALPGYRADKVADRAEAKLLMAAAGYPDGFKAQIASTATTAIVEIRVPALLSQLAFLGITADVRTYERALQAEEFKEGNWDLNVGGTAMYIGDSDPTPAWVIHMRTGGGKNYMNYSNPEVDKRIDRLLVEQDFAERKRLVLEVSDLLDNDPPYLNSGGCTGSPLAWNYLKGLQMEDLKAYPWGRYETAWLDK